MAQWMDQHFQSAPVMAKPKPARGGMGVVFLTLLLAGAGVGAYLAMRMPVEPPAAPAASATRPVPTALVAAASVTPPAASAPLPTTAPAAALAPAAAAVAPKGLAKLIEYVVDARRDRAGDLRWLDECADKRLIDAAQSAVRSGQTDAAKWSAQTALNNLFAQVKAHQQEVIRTDALCDTHEQRLVNACKAVGFPVPVVENPQTTWDGTRLRERKRPQLHEERLRITH